MANRLNAITISSFDATTLTNAYQVINAGGISEPCNIIKFVNTSDVPIMISYDGVTDHEVIRLHSRVTLNMQFNKRLPGYIAQLKQGTEIYVKYILGAGKLGDIYMIGYYQ